MQPTLTVRLFGGLGNQMFQYAAGFAASLSAGRILRLEAADSNPVLLQAFHIKDDFAAKAYQHGHLVRRIARRLNIPERGVYREPHYHFAPIPVMRISTIEGYFQSWRYFDSADQKIRDRLTPTDLSPQSVEVLRCIIDSPVSVSVHFRRGDYLTNYAQLVHGTLPASYYERGIDLLRSLVGSAARVFVFSDDPEWVKANSRLSDAFYVNSLGAPAWEDMFLMSRCQHHLIANSSYSWWGAWLNEKPGRIVVAPRQWFTPAALRERNACDLCPPDWILL